LVIGHWSLVIGHWSLENNRAFDCVGWNVSDVMPVSDFSELRVYKLSEKLSDEIWKMVRAWDLFAQDTVGKQIVRCADSIGANTAEGTGRGSYRDNRRFVTIARGSLYETRHWLRRAHRRDLLTPERVVALKTLIDDLGPRLNAYLRTIGKPPATERDRPDCGQPGSDGNSDP
jgi:four helix bundle protein